MRKIIAVLVLCVIACSSCVRASAQVTQSDAAGAMKKLSFLVGSWNCTVHGGESNGTKLHLTYSFTGNGRWLVEQNDVQGSPEWADVQMWGYDPAQQALVAYQFSQIGVSTKTVSGWNGNVFSSRRTDNGATVSVQQTSPTTMVWTIRTAAMPPQVVTQDCAR